MTTNYLRPGIYVTEQLQPLTVTAAGIPGEATAVFAAIHNQGPTVPTFCSSWQVYQNLFGTFATAPSGSMLPYAVYSYFQNSGTGCYISRYANTDAVTALLALEDLSSSVLFTVNASSPGAWGNNVYVEIIAGGSAAQVNLNVYYGGTTGAYLVETFLSVSANPASSRYIETIVNSPVNGSNYVRITNTTFTYGAGTSDFALIAPTALATGSDGTTAPLLATVVPISCDQFLQAQALLLNLPGVQSNATLNTIIAWAAAREDTFVLVDGPAPVLGETSASVAASYAGLLTGGSAINPSSYAALYAPYLLVQDPSSTQPGATRYVPPSGAMLGLYSSVDNMVGVQQVAAGTSYGQLDCLGLEVYFTPTDLNTLNPLNINAIKQIPGNGFCAFGARTLATGYPNMFIPVQRVLIKLAHDLVYLTNFALFEPNDPTLWQNVTTVLTVYMNQQTQAGLLASTNPANAFQITCNATNNPPAAAQAGIMNVSVAVALGSPAEIIVINISQLESGAVTSTQVNSLVGTPVGL
jgi:hypothetical protein